MCVEGNCQSSDSTIQPTIAISKPFYESHPILPFLDLKVLEKHVWQQKHAQPSLFAQLGLVAVIISVINKI